MDTDKYSSTTHPFCPPFGHRRSVRIEGYDYSQAGSYFVTICCWDNRHRFGKITDGEMVLDDFGKVASEQWVALMERYPDIISDMYQIMPNHIHGIIELHPCRNGDCTVDQNVQVAPTLKAIVSAYKSLVANNCLKICKSRDEYMGKLWQRNYHEHVIRSEQSYQQIANYIVNNPINWKIDRFYAEQPNCG